MHQSHLRTVDLNLLVPLQALLEERSVTRAAKRVNLSQPAMSRALERLRAHIGDDLLIRSGSQNELTPRAVELAQELMHLIPRLEEFWSGKKFVPVSADGVIRISMTDYAAALLLSSVCMRLQREAPNVTLNVMPWHSRSYEDLASGKSDLVLSPIPPSRTLMTKLLFEEHFVCLISDQHPFRGTAFSLETYLKQRHISVETEPDQQTLVDRSFAEMGLKRSISIQMPFFIPGLLALRGTEMVLTAPSMLTKRLLKRYSLRSIKAPKELPGFSYMMMWHPRLNNADLHIWFRNVVQNCAQKMAAVEKVGLRPYSSE